MRKGIVLAGMLALLFSIYQLRETFALFESNKVITAEEDLAVWKIKLNETEITTVNKTFSLTNVDWEVDENVVSGKVAPGATGSFEIVIDPTDTMVAIKYEITFDLEQMKDTAFQLDSITETTGQTLIKTGENSYTGIMGLNDIKNGRIDTIRVYLNWMNNEENNESDSEIGKTKDTIIEIPITVDIIQYAGEEIKEYKTE